MQNNTADISLQLPDILIDSSIDGIISINNDWLITTCNRAASRITGKPNPVPQGMHFVHYLPSVKEDAETIHAIEQAYKGFKTFVGASDQFTHRRHLENYFIPLFNNNAQLVGVMNIILDVAHRIKAEKELQSLHAQLEERYQQLQRTTDELARFTMVSGSLIKNPVKTLYTTIENLVKTESRNLSDKGKATFRRMQSSLNKINLLLDDMLGLAKINETGVALTAVDVSPVADEALALLKNKIAEKNVEIIKKDLCVVTGNKEQLVLLLQHLAGNAIKFNENTHPVITIACAAVAVKDAAGVEKEFHKLTITDNGIGIQQEDQQKIFELFEKLPADHHYSGSGVGLAIARKIMFAHHGFIEVSSQPGHGSVFSCYFPVAGSGN